MKKTISTLLILAMLASMLYIPAFATDAYIDSNGAIEEATSEIVLEENLTLRLVDFDNGNAAIYTIENGVTISETYIDRALKRITETDYITETIISEIEYEEANSYTTRSAAATYTRMGTIGYKLYNTQGQYMQTVTAIVSNYETTNTSAEYNINGTYKNNATLIAAIAGILALPVAVAGSVVGAIVSFLGLSATFVNTVIPDFYVDCVKYSSFWKAQDSGYPTAIAYSDGIMYKVNYHGKTTHPTSGQYYPRSSFTARNAALADMVYYGLWAHPSYTVAWGS